MTEKKRSKGRPGYVRNKFRTPVEVQQEIWERVYAKGESIRGVSAALSLNHATVKNIVHSPNGKEYEREMHEVMRRKARNFLTRHAERAAETWVNQLERANEGKRVNYQVARDLLTHIRAIDLPVSEADRGTKILIQIGTGSVGEIEDIPAIEAEVVRE